MTNTRKLATFFIVGQLCLATVLFAQITNETVVTLDLGATSNHTLELANSTEPLMVEFINPSSPQSGTITVEQNETRAKHIAWNFSGDEVQWSGVRPDLFLDEANSTRVINWSWDGDKYTLSSAAQNQLDYQTVWKFDDESTAEDDFDQARGVISGAPNFRYKIIIDGISVQLETDRTYAFGNSANVIEHLEIVCVNDGKFISGTSRLDHTDPNLEPNQFVIYAEHFVADGVEIEGWSAQGGCFKNNGDVDNNVFIIRNCIFRDCGVLPGYTYTAQYGGPEIDVLTHGCVLGQSPNGIVEVENCSFYGCNKSHTGGDHNVYVSAVHALAYNNYSVNGGNAFKINEGEGVPDPGDPPPFQVSCGIIGNVVESIGFTSYDVDSEQCVINPGAFYMFPHDYNIQKNTITGEFRRVYHTYPYSAKGFFDNNTYNVNLGTNFATQLGNNPGQPDRSFTEWQQELFRDENSSYGPFHAQVFTGGNQHGFYAEDQTYDSFSPDVPIAVGMWVYIPSGLTDQYLASLVDHDSHSTNYLFYMDKDSAGKYRARLKTNNGNTTSTGYGALPQNEWCRVWWVLENNNSRKIYVNGVLRSHSTQNWTSYTAGTQRFGIGMIPDASPTSTSGAVRIAGVEFWRAIPMLEDIQYDFNNHNKYMDQRTDTQLNRSDCMGHWRMNEGDGATIAADRFKNNDAIARNPDNLGWLGETIDFDIRK